ncbi:DNA-binding protein [Lactococcus allomyrinae]|uniref:DNA-binding protein n=1 Tax=Lactococcus allomyrinae TaxID=2419773 RepID=A0A387BDM6_9LACT|nr:DNA-binding protein [Lactococcus allomyrinae]AYF99768.1 DNA-binding protein [Lactococcus allomyrinae]
MKNIMESEKKYAKKEEIAKMFSIHPRTLDNMLTQIRRNPDFSDIILKWGIKSVRISVEGFESYLRWKQKQRTKIL